MLKVTELGSIRDKIRFHKPEAEDFCSEIVGVPTPAVPAWGKAIFFSLKLDASYPLGVKMVFLL